MKKGFILFVSFCLFSVNIFSQKKAKTLEEQKTQKKYSLEPTIRQFLQILQIILRDFTKNIK